MSGVASHCRFCRPSHVTRRRVAAALVLFLTAVAQGAALPDGGDTNLAGELEAMRQRMAEQDAQISYQLQLIEQLQGKINRQENEAWLNARRVEQVKSLVREVLADADTRASLLNDGMTAGWNNGFYLASDDGTFYLRIMGMIQVRHTTNIQDQSGQTLAGDASPDDVRAGFGITRTRFGFKGHIVDPTWTFLLWAGYDCDGNAVVLDANINKQLTDHLSITFGQFKLPYMYEYLVSETRLQFVERSLVAGRFCGTYTQGVMLTYEDDHLRLRGSINDGTSRLNTIWWKRDTEFAVTGRGEVKLTGEWKDYADWQGFPDQQPLTVIGGAVHFEVDEYGTTDADENERLNWTLDMSMERPGYNLFVALVGRHLARSDTRDQLAVIIQGGYFVTPKLELIGRYEWGDSDIADEPDLSVLTVGFNYFFNHHGLKWTTDIGIALNELSNAATGVSSWAGPPNPLGYRTDAAGSDGQIVIRNQIQLLF